MDLWEQGIWTEKDTGGLDLSWGNHEAMSKLVEMIAKREGIGDILAQGVRKAAEIVGGDGADVLAGQARVRSFCSSSSRRSAPRTEKLSAVLLKLSFDWSTTAVRQSVLSSVPSGFWNSSLTWKSVRPRIRSFHSDQKVEASCSSHVNPP